MRTCINSIVVAENIQTYSDFILYEQNITDPRAFTLAIAFWGFGIYFWDLNDGDNDGDGVMLHIAHTRLAPENSRPIRG